MVLSRNITRYITLMMMIILTMKIVTIIVRKRMVIRLKVKRGLNV